MRASLLLPLLGLACAPSAKPVVGSSPRPSSVEVAPAEPTSPPVLAAAPDAEADAAPDAGETNEGPKSGEHRLPIAIDAQHGPCVLVLRGTRFSESEDAAIFTGLDRITSEESDGCHAGVLFDVSKEPPSADPPPEPLVAGPIAKPGHLAQASQDGPAGGLIEDLNFDGANDLCITELVGAYNYSQRCWVFDTRSRTFARNADLDDMIFMEIDAKKRVLHSGYRAGGPVYVSFDRGWVQGKLVTLRQVTSYMGETPKGKRLPNGGVYEVVEERRGNRLVKVREGVSKTP